MSIIFVGKADFTAANSLLSTFEMIGGGADKRGVISLTDCNLTANQFADTTIAIVVGSSFTLHNRETLADDVFINIQWIYCYDLAHDDSLVGGYKMSILFFNPDKFQ